MTTADKNQIKQLFIQKCERMGYSQARGAVAAGTKGTTVSQVFSGKYPANDEQVYRLIAKWVDYEPNGWQLAETVNFKFIATVLKDAQQNAHVYAITGTAGSGKTETQKHYTRTNRNVFMLRCDEFWDKKTFLREILTHMGRDYSGHTLAEMMDAITRALLQLDKPLLIIDEADKLSNPVLYLFISLYNRLEGSCGLVITATGHLTVRLKRGLALNRKGYAEIWSRIGRKPVECSQIKPKDVKAICLKNGVTDQNQIQRIIDECEGDLRRVKVGVHRVRLQRGI